MIPLSSDKSMLGYELMASYPDIFCFSTTRHGGCGKGNYASFNCTPYTGDDSECVARNQALLRSLIPNPPHELVIPTQVHGTRVLAIDEGYLHASASERASMLQGVDALVSNRPGYCLCISTADCIPIILYDPVNRVAGIAHAGWRGTVNRIALHTLNKMQTGYGCRYEDMVACIGPGISLSAFEVGEEVYETFTQEGFPMEYISEWNSATHKHHIDLWAANFLQLHECGIPENRIQVAGICTYSQHNDFFSARRLGIKSGRILSGIQINDSCQCSPLQFPT